MAETRDFRSILVKVARIALVFALVFYTSLRVELLVAFADDKMTSSVTPDKGAQHEDDTLADLAVYQYVGTDKAASWKLVQTGTDAEKDKFDAVTISLDGEPESQYFVISPVWNKEEPKAKEESVNSFTLAKLTNLSDTDKKFITVVANDKNNVLTVTPQGATQTPLTVTCVVDDKTFGKKSVSFKVTVTPSETNPTPGNGSTAGGGEQPNSGNTGGGSGESGGSSTGGDGTTGGSGNDGPDGKPGENDNPESKGQDGATGDGSGDNSNSGGNAEGNTKDESGDENKSVSNIRFEILDEDGEEFKEGKVELQASDAAVEYQFGARLQAENVKFKGGASVYEWPKDGSLSTFSDNVFEDLAWSAGPDEGSAAQPTIDEKGVLTVKGKGEVTVTCIASATTASGRVQVPRKVTVVVGSTSEDPSESEDGKDTEKQEEPKEIKDPQGESHPQTQLRITSDIEFLKANGTDGSSASSSASSSDDSATAKINKTYELSELEKMQGSDKEQKFSMYAGGKSTAIHGAGVELLTLIKDAFSEAGVDYDSAVTYLDSIDFIDYQDKLTNIPFSTLVNNPSMLVALKSAVETTSLSTKANDPNGQSQDGSGDENAGDSTSTGQGSGANTNNAPSSGDVDATVSNDAGTVTDAETGTGTATGNDTGSGTETKAGAETGTDAGAGTGAGTGASANSDSSGASSEKGVKELELVDNTRFRILFNSTAAGFDADNLRYIREVRLNGIAQPTQEDDLAVRIEYKPVPLGEDAEFIAVPTHEIKGSWNCIWEVLPKGESASKVLEDENGQTLSVPTSEKTVGNRYRVTIDNEATTGAEAHLKGTSDWVELKEGETGPSVVLSYTPPRAGDMAIFRSSIYNYGGDVAKLEFAWQWSNDGGASWNTIAGETNPTLKLPTTEPSSSGSDESSSGPLYFIRVLVTTSSESDRSDYAPKDGWPMKSNVQPLTVRTGDEEFNDEVDVVDDDDGKTDGDKKKGGETKPEKQKEQEKPKPKPKPREREVNITVDNASTPSSTPSETVKPADQSLPSELYVNDDITDKIIAQEATEAAEMEATTPGARWTELKTLDGDTKNLDSVLGDNPFAPFAIPVGLGFTVAGGLEKLLAFRRQL